MKCKIFIVASYIITFVLGILGMATMAVLFYLALQGIRII